MTETNQNPWDAIRDLTIRVNELEKACGQNQDADTILVLRRYSAALYEIVQLLKRHEANVSEPGEVNSDVFSSTALWVALAALDIHEDGTEKNHCIEDKND